MASCLSVFLSCTRAPSTAPSEHLNARFTLEQQGSESFTLKAEGAFFKFVNRQENLVRYHANPQIAIAPNGLWAAAKDKRLALEPEIVISNSQQTAFVICTDGMVYIRDAGGKQIKAGRLILYHFEHPETLTADADGFVAAIPEAGGITSMIPETETITCQ